MPEAQENVRVARTDKAYLKVIEKRQNWDNCDEKPFGHELFKHIEGMQRLQASGYDIGGLTERRNELLSGCREDLQKMETLHSPRFLDYLAEFRFPGDSNHGWSGFEAKRKFESLGKNGSNFSKDVLSDKSLEKLIMAHVKRFKDFQVSFGRHNYDLFIYSRRRNGSFLLNFSEDISEKIENGEFLLSKDVLKQQLERFKLITVDGLRSELTSCRDGCFDPDTNTVAITEQEARLNEMKTYTHELFHALSGQALIREGRYKTQKTGLYFTAGETYRFRWLNEAVTETLARQLPVEVFFEDGVYENEREIYKLLQTKGKIPIDKKLFLNAYFENYDHKLPYGERMPEWKKLSAAINYAYYPGFLVKLDNFIEANGIEKTIEVMQRDWTEIAISKSGILKK